MQRNEGIQNAKATMIYSMKGSEQRDVWIGAAMLALLGGMDSGIASHTASKAYCLPSDRTGLCLAQSDMVSVIALISYGC